MNLSQFFITFVNLQSGSELMRRHPWQYWAKYIFFGLYMLIILYPIWFVVLSSFKDNTDLFSNPWGLPKVLLWRNYTEVLFKYDLITNFFNSLTYATVGSMISLVICAMASFALARMRWKLSKLTLGFFMLGLMVPIQSTLVPLYISVSQLNLNNPKFNIVSVFVAFSIPTTIFILTGFMASLPRELEEAAVIDGCSIPKAFWWIILPLTKPALATVTILNFLHIWNDLMYGLIFLNNEKDKTLQLGIMRFQSNFGSNYGYALVGIVVAIIPSILIYAILQDKLVKGMTAGAIKG
jgi:raffinose/stachyose/melibiose transport system permease protein